MVDAKVVTPLIVLALTACTQATSTSALPPTAAAPSRVVMGGVERAALTQDDLPTPIAHVVIVIQENRTPDNLFQGIPGADIARFATDSQGERVALAPVSLSAPYDLHHDHASFVKDYADGEMDGFDAGLSRKTHLRPFGYAPEPEVAPYHDMAKQYVLADRMFQSNEGPSFPAHLYLISGTASDPALSGYRVRDNPYDRITGHAEAGGCDAPSQVVVATIEITTGDAGPTPFPCFDRTVISDLLDAKRVSWRYYQEKRGAGLWHPFDAIKHVRYGKEYANVVTPSQQFLTDVRRGDLAGVTWIAPADQWSDHAGRHATTQGPSWVAAIVNAVGRSQFWKGTAIFVVWDDWGGWYDHVAPPIDNAYELGCRVPLLVISPYAKRGYVSKVPHEFGSLLAFTEETYGIPKGSLGTTDQRADDLKDAFDFTQKPRTFVPIKAPPFRPGADQSSDEDP
jgi:phospholipase C